jgi:hypothetical protein
MALMAGPSSLLGLWLIASGLRPYARTQAALDLRTTAAA